MRDVWGAVRGLPRARFGTVAGRLLDFECFFSSSAGNGDLALDALALVEEGRDILPVVVRNESSCVGAPLLQGQPAGGCEVDEEFGDDRVALLADLLRELRDDWQYCSLAALAVDEAVDVELRAFDREEWLLLCEPFPRDR